MMDKKIKLAYSQSKIRYSYHNDVQEIEKLHLEKLIKGFELGRNQIWYNVGLGLLDKDVFKNRKPTVKLKLTSSFSNDKFAIVFEIVSESILVTEDGKLTYEEYTNYINCNKEKLFDPLLLDAINHVLNVSKSFFGIPIFLDYRKAVMKNFKKNNNKGSGI